MSKASSLFLALTLGSGIFLGGCTVDAQLASSLLNSLKGKIEDNTDADGKVSLSAKDVSEAADEAGVRIVCGGKDMAIASLDEDEDEDADEDEVIEAADIVHPVMLGYGPGGPRGGYAQAIHIDINLGQELGRLNQYRGAERDLQYRKIQQRFPQMAHARPIPVKGGSSKEIVFGEFCGCDDEHGSTRATSGKAYARPTSATAPARPVMGYAGRPMPGQFMPGRRVTYAHAVPAMPAGEATAAVPARRVAWAGMPIEGFKNAKGQPCELLSATADANEDDESDSQDSSDDNEDEDED